MMPQTIYIGHLGEANSRHFDIDISQLLALAPDATPVLFVKRNGDADAYPAVTELHGTSLRWLFSAVDTAVLGFGECQVVLTNADGTVIAKSNVIRFCCKQSLSQTEEVPEPFVPWVAQVAQIKAHVDGTAGQIDQKVSDFSDFLKSEKEDIVSSAATAEQAKNTAVNASRDADAAKSAAQTAQRQTTQLLDDASGALAGKQDKLVAGANIMIDGNTISATGGGQVTADAIHDALGYTPANEDDIPDVPVKSVSAGGAAITPDANDNVDIPAANASTYGLVKAHPSANWKPQNNFGLYVDSDGLLMTSPADATMIDAKSDNRHLIPPNLFDYATRGSLISNSQITPADYPAIHKTLGLEKEWVLKGTITDATKNDMLNVDMSGCTELFIDSISKSASRVIIMAFTPNGLNSFQSVTSMSQSTTNVKVHYVSFYREICGYVMPVLARYAKENEPLTGSVTPRPVTTIENITAFRLMITDETTTTIDSIKIYAR